MEKLVKLKEVVKRDIKTSAHEYYQENYNVWKNCNFKDLGLRK